MNVKHHPLRVERKLRGWSQDRVAEAIGTSTRTVARWEQGEVLPQPFYRERLCELFGKNAQELGIISRLEAQAFLPLPPLFASPDASERSPDVDATSPVSPSRAKKRDRSPACNLRLKQRSPRTMPLES